MKKTIIGYTALFLLAASLQSRSQTLVSLGATPPNPGPNDISQLSIVGDQDNPDGINYYIDKPGAPVGQTFTTGANPGGYVLDSVTVKSSRSNGFGGTGPQTYEVRIYLLSGTTATLVSTYISQSFSYTSLDWLQMTGLATTLAPNTTYAYTWLRTTTGWDGLANATGNPYAGGKVCAIPPAGGTVSFGNGAGDCDAAFSLGISLPSAPVTSAPTANPNPVYALSPLTLAESAAGQEPLFYQWRTDGGSGGPMTNIVSATNATQVVFPPDAGTTYSVNYDVIVTNASGASTSAVVAVTVNAAAAPLVTQEIAPVGTNIYAYVGGEITLSAAFTGTQPIAYQWQANTGSGYTNIPLATNATVTLTNLQLFSAGSYRLAATNIVGSSNTTPASIVVLNPLSTPTASQPYAYAIYTNNPVGYWRLSETLDTFTNVVQAYDYSGHNRHAVYGHGVSANIPSPQSPAFPGMEASNTGGSFINGAAGSYLDVPALNLNTNTVTITAWIKPNSIVGTFWGLFMWRGPGGDTAGLGFGSTLNGSGVAELGYTWNTNSSSTWGFNSGLYPVAGEWSMVTLVITPTNATLYLYSVAGGSTNLLKAGQTLAHGPEAFSGGTLRIGSDNFDGRNFDGVIDEVAVFNRSLSENEVQGLFLKALGTTGVAPSVGNHPASLNTYAGQTVQFTANGGGVPSPTIQWQSAPSGAGPWSNLANNGHFAGVNTSTLTINDALPSDAIAYRMLLSNSSGNAASDPATLTLAPIPTNGQWTVNFQVTNNINGTFGLWGSGSYTGKGILGSGTFWNPIPANGGAWGYGVWSSASGLRDNGSTPSGIGCIISGNGAAGAATPYPANDRRGLLTQHIAIYGYVANWITFTNVPDGWYNLALVGTDGPWVDRGTTFVVHGSNGDQTGSTVNAQYQQFSDSDNAVIFTNVRVTGGTLFVDGFPTTPVPTHDPNGEGYVNAAQLQLVFEDVQLSTAWNGSQLTLTWPAGTLLEATNVLGPWVTNLAPSPVVITPNPAVPQKFYRVQLK